MLLAGVTAAATITFDELPFQPVDGVTFQWVTFGYEIDGVSSDLAHYASFMGSQDLTTISDPSLVGDSAGLLTVDFEIPTSIVQFGAALSTADALNPGYSVELFDDAAQLVGVFPVDTAVVGGELAFSEALFSYEGDPVVTAIIDFADEPGSFALDNLVYEIPEPAAAWMWIGAWFGCVYWLRRNR